MMQVHNEFWWLPLVLGLLFLIPIFLRHRTKPVGLFGWAIPLAVALATGLVFTGNGFVDALNSAEAATHGIRIRIAAKGMAETLRGVAPGLLSATIIGALIPWLIPSSSEQEKVRWRTEFVILGIGVGILSAAWLALGNFENSFAWLYFLGVVFLLGQGLLSFARIRVSTASWEQRAAAVGALGVSVLGWLVLARASASSAIWDSVAHATPENRISFVHRAWEARGVLSMWSTTALVVAVLFLAVAARVYFPSTQSHKPALAGWRRRTALALVLTVLVAAPHIWLLITYRQPVQLVADEVALERNPYANNPEFRLPSAHFVRTPDEAPSVRIGREKTFVSERLDTRDSARVGTPSDLISAMRDAIARKQREAKLLMQPYDSLLVLAVDRCVSAPQVVTTMRGAHQLGVYRLQLMVEDETHAAKVHQVLMTQSSQDEKQTAPLLVVLSPSGIDITWGGKHMSSTENHDVAGPTIPALATKEECGEATQDWAGFSEKLVELKGKSPEETVMLLRVEEGIPWQSVIRLIDTADYRDSKTVDAASELFPDPVFTL